MFNKKMMEFTFEKFCMEYGKLSPDEAHELSNKLNNLSNDNILFNSNEVSLIVAFAVSCGRKFKI